MEAQEQQNRGCFFFIVMLMLTLIPISQAYAQCEQWLAKAAAIEGQVNVLRKGDDAWSMLGNGDALCQGDQVRVQAASRLALEMPNETIARLDEHTAVEFVGEQEADRSWWDMLQGVVHFISRVPRSLTIKTPYMNAAVEGTEFLVEVSDDESSVVVFEGIVSASNSIGQIDAAAGQRVVASKEGGMPVVRVVVNPWDAVQWALYYPPLLSLGTLNMDGLSSSEAGMLKQAVAATESGNVNVALRSLDDLPHQSPLLVYKASLLLSVGRVDEARLIIDAVLDSSPEDGNALALSSIIATTQNNREQALATAIEAVAYAPDLAAPHLALSYAWQSRFELEHVRNVLEGAVERIPDDALLWARLAEVRLMFREIKSAMNAAQTATKLAPNNAHARTTLGFAYLLRMKNAIAQKTFGDAIDLDPGAPLPRLGRGLALIRSGNLVEGRRHLEIAVALDPSNALLRSYLGKAYYEEKRNPLAADQFELAKSLDSNDPTAWFYDAIRKQTENRPVEAMGDLEQAIAKNENRAVHRSQLLLDDDNASRNSSLARIYQDLGFEELALLVGWRSLNKNPANHSAHRLLADAYIDQPRNEFARLSETLQSQMLSPVGLSQIPPSLIQSDIPVSLGYGFSSTGLNELSNLFVRDGVAVQVNGMVGADATFGEEIIVSGLKDNMAFSIGQLHLETDGYRPNSGISTELFSAFFQYDVSPNVSSQVEFRRKLRENGDVRELVNDGNISLELEQDRTDNSARAGLRISPAHNNHYLFSVGWGALDATHDDVLLLGGLVNDVSINLESEGFSYEFQNIRVYDDISWVWGGAYERGDKKDGSRLAVGDGDIEFFSSISEESRITEHSSLYVYSTININDAHSVMLGGGWDDHRNRIRGQSQFNPKLGWTWLPTDVTTIRAATFRTMRRSLFLRQTLEPTQVAGFAQIFGENPGSDVSVYAAAVDQRLGSRASIGVEGVRRRLEAPVIVLGSDEVSEDDWEDRWYKAYFNYVISKRWVYSVGYDWSKTSKKLLSEDMYSDEDPVKFNMEVLGVSLSYSHHVGLSSRLDFSYVSQDSWFNQAAGKNLVREKFSVVDYELGFRLPRRAGSVSFLIRNLFDNSFSTQQGRLFSARPLTETYYPEQAYFVRFNLSFQ